MIRFIVNFFLFGLLFYALYIFFPDAFAKMVGWVAAVFDYIRDIVNQIIEKINSTRSPTAPHAAFLLGFMNFFRKV